MNAGGVVGKRAAQQNKFHGPAAMTLDQHFFGGAEIFLDPLIPDHSAEHQELRRLVCAAAGFFGKEFFRIGAGPDNNPDHFDVYQNYEIDAGQRDELRDYLSDNGVGTLIQWGGTPVHMHRELGFDDAMPITEKFFERCFMLPMHTALSEGEVDRICELIRGFYRLEG